MLFFSTIFLNLNQFAGQFVTGLSPSKTVFYLLPTKSNGGPCNARPEIWRGHGLEPLLTAFCAAKHRLSRKSVSHTTISSVEAMRKSSYEAWKIQRILMLQSQRHFRFLLVKRLRSIYFHTLRLYLTMNNLFLHHYLHTISLEIPASRVSQVLTHNFLGPVWQVTECL